MRYDEAYANAKHIPGGADYPARWAAAAAGFRAACGDRARLGLGLGPGDGAEPAGWFDLFLPEGAARGLVIFVHGGYWLRFGPRDFSHLAAGPLARGWAVAMPAYTLAPAARIAAMTRQIVAAAEQGQMLHAKPKFVSEQAKRRQREETAAALDLQGVLLLRYRGCEAHAFDAVALARALDSERLPCLQLELEPGEPISAQAATRLEAFLEMLSGLPLE
jgi:hypothetical protein